MSDAMLDDVHPENCRCLPCLYWTITNRLDYVRRRLVCRVFKHKLETEYRAPCDVYGETWCARCGEDEPTKWCRDE